jgi:hypothetical protein
VTQQELAAAMAGMVKDYVRADRAALETRLALAEARLASLEPITKEFGQLRERVALVEVRPVQPGPPGDPGPPGKDGTDGKPGLTYCGVYVEGKQYERGDLATWAGATWHCNEPTETKPGDGSKAWTLMVKRGRDGKDGKP